MDKFIDNWQKDKRFRAKIKLLLYGLFIISVTIYAISLNNNVNYNSNELINENENDNKLNNEIIIPKQYNYRMEIIIDDNNYKYYGTKTDLQMTINKVIDNKETNYIFKDNEYYLKDNDLYIKTTREEVYDVINYNYINLENINNYLNKATKDNNQYLVYLKDIILGNDSNEYFVILLNDDNINIDYTPLMKQFNNNIKKYKVNIYVEEIE